MSFGLYGRRMIKSDETEVTVENVVAILNKALPYHWENRSEIQYLWYYYRGLQPILNREKQVRPEICNKIVENRANEIVSFKSGYLMGEPLQYVSRGNGDNLSDAINQLNEFVFAEEKPAKDKELADWFHICGTSFRMVAFEHCGLFVDSDLAYTLSAEYAEEQEKKAQELLEKQNTEKEDETDDSNTDKGNGTAGGNAAQARQQSGSAD